VSEEGSAAVDTLTITARSLVSARGLYDALARFHPEVVESDDGSHSVTVDLRRDIDVIAVLKALQEHLTARHDGPARLELEGRSYTMHPADD
jgi:hypothetical protein